MLFGNKNVIHGFKRKHNTHPLYNAWSHMWDRCENQKGKNWKDYGGRGITVCEEWESFLKFAADMFPTWKQGLMLDRIKNNEGYSKPNCRWATRKEQNSNKRNVQLIKTGNKCLTKIEIAQNLGGNRNLIHVRLRRGWTLERAISTPKICP